MAFDLDFTTRASKLPEKYAGEDFDGNLIAKIIANFGLAVITDDPRLLVNTSRELTQVYGRDEDGNVGYSDLVDFSPSPDVFYRSGTTPGATDGKSRGVAAATAAQGLDPSDTEHPLVPSSLAGMGGKGTDIASATSITIPSDGAYFHLTGNTGPIGAIAWANGGRRVRIYVESNPTLTHSSTLICPGNISMVLAAGDVFDVVKDGTAARIFPINRAGGATAVTPSGGNAAINGAAIRRNVTIAAAAAVDLVCTNLEINVDYNIAITASGGSRAVTASGHKTVSKGSLWSVTSGKTGWFIARYDGTNVWVFFAGYED